MYSAISICMIRYPHITILSLAFKTVDFECVLERTRRVSQADNG